MKHGMNKIIAIALSAVLLLSSALLVFAALDTPLPGQKELGISQVTTRPVMDGKVTGSEYGLSYPQLRLKLGEGFWAEDASGNKITNASNLPEYVDLYLARDKGAVYVAVSLPEMASTEYQAYELTTFLGFGSSESSHTMNSGASTTFRTYRKSSGVRLLSSWWGSTVKNLVAKAYNADGSEKSAERLYNLTIDVPNSADLSTVNQDNIRYYPLPYWGEVKNGVATIEAELNLEDSVKSSGAVWNEDSLPSKGYFAFDLAVFANASASSPKCILHFNADLGSAEVEETNPAKTVPHILKMNDAPDASQNNAALASLSATNEAGDVSYRISPAVSENRSEYEVEVLDGTTSVKIGAVPAVSGAEVKITGADNISPTGNNIITIEITAKGGYKRVYTIKVVWSGTLALDFFVDCTNGSDETGTGENGNEFKTIEKALAKIQEIADTTGWDKTQAARINFNGTNLSNETDAETVLFGQKTIFNKEGNKLPIIICGDNQATSIIKVSAARVACANDYTFQNLTFPISDTATEFYAGCGEIVFRGCAMNGSRAGDYTNGSIFADNFTQKALLGWTEENLNKALNPNGKFVTSVTFASMTEFNSSVGATVVPNIAAVGAKISDMETASGLSLSPADMVSYVIVDGGKVGRISARLGDSNVSHAYVEVQDGSVQQIVGGDGLNMSTRPEKTTVNGDITVTVSGGKLAASDGIQILTNADLRGNLTINITGGTITNIRYAPITGANHSIYGDAIFNMSGGTIGAAVLGATTTKYTSDMENAVISGKVENNISGGTISNMFYSFYCGKVTSADKKIVNNISGGTLGGTIYLGGGCHTWKKSTAPNIVNNITGGTFTGTVQFGAAYAYIDSLKNTISKATFEKDVYLGHNIYVYQNMTNTINSGTFKGSVYAGTYSASSVVNNVTNYFKGGTFSAAVYASEPPTNPKGEVRSVSGCTIKNIVTGGTFKNNFYGGRNSAAMTANIINEFKGGTFSADIYGGSNTGNITGNITNLFTLTFGGTGINGGCRGLSDSAPCVIDGNITNTVEGSFKMSGSGTFAGTSRINLQNQVTGKVHNIVRKDSKGNIPQFSTSQDFSAYLGGYRTVIGKGIVNDLYEGNFPEVVFGAPRVISDGVMGVDPETGYSVVNNIYNVTIGNGSRTSIGFHGAGWGGSKQPAGAIQNNVYGGTIYGFVGAYRSGTAEATIENNIYGGTFYAETDWDDVCFFGSTRGVNASQQGSVIAAVTTTIYDGTFHGIVYNGGRGAAPVKDSQLIIKGGTFEKFVSAHSAKADSTTDAKATLTLKPESDITLMASPVVRSTSYDSVQLQGANGKIFIDSDVSITATSHDGKQLIIQQTEGFVNGTTYLTVNSASTENLFVVAGSNVSGFVKKASDSSKTTWTGASALTAADLTSGNLLLEEKITLKLWFDKEKTDAAQEESGCFSFILERNDLDKPLLVADYAYLTANAEVKSYQGKDYYVLSLPGTSPSAFHTEITAIGSNLVGKEFSINSMLRTMIDSGNYTEAEANLAKAMWNYGIEAYNRFSGKTSTLAKETVSEPAEVTVINQVINVQDSGVAFLGKSLVLREAVGIKFFGQIEGGIDPENLPAGFEIRVNGKTLTADEFEIKAEENASYNASITVYIAAASMNTSLEVSVYKNGALCASYTESVTSACQQYVNAGSADALLCKAILAYVEAIRAL